MSDSPGPEGQAPDTATPAGAPPRPECLCMGLGPQITAALRGTWPDKDLVDQFRQVQLEVLKLVRTLVEQRIANLADQAPASKGTKLTVE